MLASALDVLCPELLESRLLDPVPLQRVLSFLGKDGFAQLQEGGEVGGWGNDDSEPVQELVAGSAAGDVIDQVLNPFLRDTNFDRIARDNVVYGEGEPSIVR